MILDKFRLDGKAAVVTGGSRGLGAAMAEGLAQAGADVAIVSREINPEFQKRIEALGRKCVHIPADLINREEAKKVIPAAREALGRIDILINNAGICPRHEIVDFPEEDWDRTLELNLSTAFLLSQAAGKVMLEQGDGGKIINTGSVMSYQGGMLIPAYAATKHGIAGLTKSLSNAWAAKGINVNAIAPGYFSTDLTDALRNNSERRPFIDARIPAGRWGDPKELAGAALFLSSEAGSYVHGAVICVDGGWMSV